MGSIWARVRAMRPMRWEAAWDPLKRKWLYPDKESGRSSWTRPQSCHLELPSSTLDLAPPTNSGANRPQGRNSARDYARPACPPRGQRREGDKWNAVDCAKRLERASASGDISLRKAILRQVAENNYQIRWRWRSPKTVLITSEQSKSARLQRHRQQPVVTTSTLTTVDAVLYFARVGGIKRKICALNFANGSYVGGGYKNGSTAQEEDLCRRIPCLFTSLIDAQRAGLYPFGPSTYVSPAKVGRYSDVLWTPGVAVARSNERTGFGILPREEEVQVDIVSAAAPNIRFAKPPEVNDRNLVHDTIRNILIAPKLVDPELTTIVLGAWGCGAFGGNPDVIGKLFCKALFDQNLGSLYKEIHFAIPVSANDHNYHVFRDILQRRGVVVANL